jgi:hypothetical protein
MLLELRHAPTLALFSENLPRPSSSSSASPASGLASCGRSPMTRWPIVCA